MISGTPFEGQKVNTHQRSIKITAKVPGVASIGGSPRGAR